MPSYAVESRRTPSYAADGARRYVTVPGVGGTLTCTKLEKIEFAQKLPGHAQIQEGSISWEPIFF